MIPKPNPTHLEQKVSQLCTTIKAWPVQHRHADRTRSKSADGPCQTASAFKEPPRSQALEALCREPGPVAIRVSQCGQQNQPNHLTMCWVWLWCVCVCVRIVCICICMCMCMCMCICDCACVCVYACMYVSVCVYIYVYTYTHMYRYIRMYVCMHVCMYVFTDVCMHARTYLQIIYVSFNHL